MKKILTSFALVAASLAFAQVGINAGDSDTNEIAPDAVFHVKNKGNEKKGVVLPSVSLTSATDKVTTSNGTNQVTTGLMVWNDGNSGLTPAGYYYWDGAKWVLTGNVDNGGANKVEFITSGTTYSASGDSYLIVNTSGDDVTINLKPAEIKGKEVCVFQKGDGGISFSNSTADMRGPATTWATNTGACYIYDGSSWLGVFGF